jgi:hypothetical protein
MLQVLEFCRRRESVGRLASLPATVIGAFGVSPDGDDTMWLWHLQDQVGIVRNRHELGEFQPSPENIVRHLEIGDLKL